MGVPAFFRWLSKKYPSIVVHCVEEKPLSVSGVKIPVDNTLPNPNGVEFDNLYLDMNGIIHPCCHPEDKPEPKNEDDMMILIFEYIDRLFSIVRPRKLLYMAIDGVAPRAKMNQQRSRRFRASKETADKLDEIERYREELESQGAQLPPPKSKTEHFDSNCITPGTPFMARLAQCLHYYVHDRLNNDPAWKNIKVILSDANVPGEGEHKIMDFIRRQRANPDHDPNTHHCLCGADADLIMLGLATHEVNFTIIREEFKPNKPRSCDICGQMGHEMKDCTGLAKVKQGEFDELDAPVIQEQEFIFLRLNVLREYLEKELTMHNLPFPFDLERAIDDWVFMCFFVGNDFLPHLPSLEIREGAIDRLINLYQSTVRRTGGFLTDSGKVHLERVQLILTDLGEVEDEIFKTRQENELAMRRKQKERKKRMKYFNDRPAWTPMGQFAPNPIQHKPAAVTNARHEAYQMRMQGYHTEQSYSGNADAAKAIKAKLKGEKSTKNEESTSVSTNSLKRKWEHVDQDSSDDEPEDNVRLWEEGWKNRYYENKFDIKNNNIAFRHRVAAAYCEGLCWVLSYYYQGCASWKWFFPYHYAPFASDFVNVGELSGDFEEGTKPFKPLEQLMSVFPAASKQHLPISWGELMIDPESPIIDFYPDNFKVDLNGKRFAWQGVALLPFVDEQRLLNTLKDVYPLLTEDEVKRNVRGDDKIYVSKHHPSYNFLLCLYEDNQNSTQEFSILPKLFDGMAGVVLPADDVVHPDGTLESILPGLPDLTHNQALCARFRDPVYPPKFIFESKRLPGAIEPIKVLRPDDCARNPNSNWRPQIGMAPATQRAYLDVSGHRKLGRNVDFGQHGQSYRGSQQHFYPHRGSGKRGEYSRSSHRYQNDSYSRYNNYNQYNDSQEAQHSSYNNNSAVDYPSLYNHQSYSYGNYQHNNFQTFQKSAYNSRPCNSYRHTQHPYQHRPLPPLPQQERYQKQQYRGANTYHPKRNN